MMSIIHPSCLPGNYLFKQRFSGENITADSATKIKATLQSDVLQPNNLGVRCLSFYWSIVQYRCYKLEVYVKSMSRFLVTACNVFTSVYTRGDTPGPMSLPVGYAWFHVPSSGSMPGPMSLPVGVCLVPCPFQWGYAWSQVLSGRGYTRGCVPTPVTDI